MDLKRFNHRVPLLIGPTGALSMPLEAFTPKLKDMLRSALSKLEEASQAVTATE